MNAKFLVCEIHRYVLHRSAGVFMCSAGTLAITEKDLEKLLKDIITDKAIIVIPGCSERKK